MPEVDHPPAYREMAQAVFALIATYASGDEPNPALEEQIRLRVKPQLIDWNLGRTQARLARHGASTPEGFPEPPPKATAALHETTNAALRLHHAAKLHRSGDEQWHAVLTLVALHIVGHHLGGGSPLYNHVETEDVLGAAASVHETLCAKLRAELNAIDEK